MKKTIIYTILTIILSIFVSNSLSPVFAASINCKDKNIPEAVRKAAGCSGNSEDDFRSSISTILSAIIGVVGLVSVAFIIIGGINYMTSAGDASKVEKAKKTILYALIGLAVCALAFVIVNFTITSILKQ